MAERRDSTRIPISHLIRDPMVRRAFERAERDDGHSFALPATPRPRLPGGASVKLREAAHAHA